MSNDSYEVLKRAITGLTQPLNELLMLHKEITDQNDKIMKNISGIDKLGDEIKRGLEKRQ